MPWSWTDWAFGRAKDPVDCCVNGNQSSCGLELVRGERSCDATLIGYCTDPKNQYADPRCSCFRTMRYLTDPSKRASYLCFHKNCEGPDKLIPRAWRDERCPDYVNCQTQLLFGGNIHAGPAKIEQDCLAGKNGLLFQRGSVIGAERASNEESTPGSVLFDTGFWVVVGASLLLLLLFGIVVTTAFG